MRISRYALMGFLMLLIVNARADDFVRTGADQGGGFLGGVADGLNRGQDEAYARRREAERHRARLAAIEEAYRLRAEEVEMEAQVALRLDAPRRTFRFADLHWGAPLRLVEERLLQKGYRRSVRPDTNVQEYAGAIGLFDAQILVITNDSSQLAAMHIVLKSGEDGEKRYSYLISQLQKKYGVPSTGPSEQVTAGFSTQFFWRNSADGSQLIVGKSADNQLCLVYRARLGAQLIAP